MMGLFLVDELRIYFLSPARMSCYFTEQHDGMPRFAYRYRYTSTV